MQTWDSPLYARNAFSSLRVLTPTLSQLTLQLLRLFARLSIQPRHGDDVGVVEGEFVVEDRFQLVVVEQTCNDLVALLALFFLLVVDRLLLHHHRSDVIWKDFTLRKDLSRLRPSRPLSYASLSRSRQTVSKQIVQIRAGEGTQVVPLSQHSV